MKSKALKNLKKSLPAVQVVKRETVGNMVVEYTDKKVEWSEIKGKYTEHFEKTAERFAQRMREEAAKKKTVKMC